MLTKRAVIMKIIFVLFNIIPYNTIFYGLFYFPVYLILGFLVFYFLINIIACQKIGNSKWIKYTLNILDGMLVFFAGAGAIIWTIITVTAEGEVAYLLMIYPIFGAIFTFGLLGLFLNNSMGEVQRYPRNIKE
jgi:hypothetical protein